MRSVLRSQTVVTAHLKSKQLSDVGLRTAVLLYLGSRD